jgi:hypothetical protein
MKPSQLGPSKAATVPPDTRALLPENEQQNRAKLGPREDGDVDLLYRQPEPSQAAAGFGGRLTMRVGKAHARHAESSALRRHMTMLGSEYVCRVS